MKPRQKVHSLLLISELILYLSILILSIIGCIKYPKRYEKIWFCSKILTLKEIIVDNMNNIYPFKSITSENNYTLINMNYSYLLQHSTKNVCEPNFKKCGILDTNQNIMCIPQSDECPINEIKNDMNLNSYNNTLFKYYDYELYFSNNSIDDDIITNLTISNEKPKYINTNNFIFDEITYLEGESSSSGDGDYDDDGYNGYDGGDSGGYDGGYDGGDSGGYGGGGDDGGIGDGFGGWRNLYYDDIYDYYVNRELTNYILNKFNENINIDKYYKNIYGNLYTRNYIGFDNIEEINKFINSDFRYNYKKIFPNKAAIIFGYISTIPFIILFIFEIKRLTYKDTPFSTANAFCVYCSKIMVIILYMIFFLGYFLYFIKIFKDLHKINCTALKKIKTEDIIEDFIKSFCKINNFKNIFIIIEISLFSLSLIIFILGWIVHIIVQRNIDKNKEIWKNKDITEIQPTPSEMSDDPK